MARVANIEKLLEQQHAEMSSLIKTYTDPKERTLKPSSRGQIEEMPLETLDAEDQERVELGEQLVNMLLQQLMKEDNPGDAVPRVKICPVTALPEKNGSRSAFPNSVLFDPLEAILFIRIERLSNPGELFLVLLHTTAHILTDPYSMDDTELVFIRDFHRCVRLCCLTLLETGGSQWLNTLKNTQVDNI